MNLALYAFLLGAPLAMLVCLALRGRAAGRVAVVGAALTLVGGSWLAVSVTWRGPWIAAHGWLHVDAPAWPASCLPLPLRTGAGAARSWSR